MISSIQQSNKEQLVSAPFCNASKSFFSMMLDSKCDIIESVPHGEHELEPITASVGISGVYKGIVCISVTEETAKMLLNRMTGLESEDVDDFVIDAVGEMANMIGGQGKRELSKIELQLGLPKILTKESELLFETPWEVIHHLVLETDIGTCTLSVLFDLPPE